MKIRNGFVSNSSSSSFVVLLPKSFDPDIFADNLTDEQLNPNKWDSYDREEVRKIVKMLVDNGSIWRDEGAFLCAEILGDYVIGSTEGGPDDGSVNLVSEKGRERIKNILKEEL